MSKDPPKVSSVHTPGHVEVMFSEDGSIIYTGGDDSQLYAFSTSNVRAGSVGLATGLNCDEHDAGILTMSLCKNVLITGSDDQFVRLVSTGQLKCEKVIHRSTVPISSVALSPDAKRVAVASDESAISVYELTRSETRRLKGHVNSVKHISFDPLGQILASTSQDGTLRFWNMSEEIPSCIQEIKGIISKVGREGNELSRGSWHPDGATFACPGKNGEVLIIERNKWKVIAKLNHKDKVSICSYSPNGIYLLVVGAQGGVTIWRPDDNIQECTVLYPSSSRACSVAWHPKANEVILGDASGALQYLTKVIPDGLPHPVTGTEKRKNVQKSDQVRMAEVAIQLFDKESEDTLMDNSHQASILLAGQPAKKTQVEDLDALYKEDMAELFGDENDEDIDADEELRDFVVDDDGAGYLEELDNDDGMHKYRERSHQDAHKRLLKETSRSTMMEISSLPFDAQDSQEPFQSNATPLRGSRRYLAFNLHGYVAYIENPTNCTIQVEFHDKTNRGSHFSDIFKFSMAALGSTGVVVASTLTATAPSVIHFRPFGTWASHGDWTARLSEGENAQAVAITKAHIAVATDQYYLRLFSYGGLQTEVRCLPGRVVTMTGSENLLVVVYHDGPVNANDQTESFIILDLEVKKVIHRGRLPLSPDSKLEWIGFSAENLLTTYDSRGVLRLMLKSMDFDWVPILDTRTVKKNDNGLQDHHYWPVGVADSKFMYILCKGQKYPASDRPLLHEIPLHLPLANLDGPAAALEERWLREQILSREAESPQNQHFVPSHDVRRKEVEIDKIGIQLFLAACRSEHVERALDLAANFYNDKTLDGAMKIAVSQHLPSLAERLNSMKEGRYAEKVKAKQEYDTSHGSQNLDFAYVSVLEAKRAKKQSGEVYNAAEKNHNVERLSPIPQGQVDVHEVNNGESTKAMEVDTDEQPKKKRKKPLNPFAVKPTQRRDNSDRESENPKKTNTCNPVKSHAHLFQALRTVASEKQSNLDSAQKINPNHAKEQKQTTLFQMLPQARVHLTSSVSRAGSSATSKNDNISESDTNKEPRSHSNPTILSSFAFKKESEEKENLTIEPSNDPKGKTKTYSIYPDLESQSVSAN